MDDAARLLWVVVVALPAHCDVHVGSSNLLDLVALHDPFGEGSVGGADHADSREFDHVFCERDQLQDGPKGFPPEIAVERRYDDRLAELRHVLAELDNVREELPFINTNHIIPEPRRR